MVCSGTLRLGSYFIQELRCEVSAIGPFDGDRSQRILDKLILVQQFAIGIVLYPEADRVVVEYAMSRSMSPTMIAEYKRILIPQERMQQQLNEFCNLFSNES